MPNPKPEVPEDAERVFRALRSMSGRERDAFILHRIESWSYARIGAHMACTPEQVERLIGLALVKLWQAMEGMNA